MKLYLSWDLFLLAFFAVVVAYSFIIGKNQTLKVILGTYIAILCADGLGNIFTKYLISSGPFLRFMSLFGFSNGQQTVAIFKVIVLMVLVVTISVKGLFQVESEENGNFSIRFLVTSLLGVLSAGLLISTVLVFISGTSLIGGTLSEALRVTGNSPGSINVFQEAYDSSRLIRIMLDYANLWFFLPGLVFVAMSVFHKKSA